MGLPTEIGSDPFGPQGPGGTGGGGGSLKDQLAKLLKNPKCAALLGGGKNAAMVLAHLNGIVNVDTQSGTSPNYVRAKNDIDIGGAGAETPVPQETQGYIVNGSWAGGNFNIYVGNYFASLSSGAQLSVLVHETIHGATTGRINQWMVDLQTATVPGMGSPRFGNIYAIAKNCGTALPPGY